MNKTYLLLGSNMGNSPERFTEAHTFIETKIGKVTRQSAFYKTAPWGNPHQPDFLNQVIMVQTDLTPFEVLENIFTIEKTMGRIRTVKNAPRIIDIDILFFNNEIIQQKMLTIPHPEIVNRRFVLIPLNELSPRLVHPVLNKTIEQLLLDCTDTQYVKKF